nr:PREDICTED: sprT-like domain-containing protein Spartan [Lepisosteus oculatus]
MSMDEDFLLALQLQDQFDQEASVSIVDDDDDYVQNKKRRVETSDELVTYPRSSFRPERPLSIVDESWEMLDPSPDVRAMFLQFNDMFFWGRLAGVEVKWSPRMTLCAGVCSYEGRGGLCSIRLSEPLLKLRPRRDLVETLLHEMIHALLFVTQNNRDRDGHGPEFCKHMNRINKASGTNITIYHSFHDEVDLYRTHWWRCDGPCQTRRPFFGYVKRATNRAPSARDPWWPQHQQTCGGTFIKVKEPEDYGKKGKKAENNKKGGTQQKDKSTPTAAGHSGSLDIRTLIPFSGKGFVLGHSSQATSSQEVPRDGRPSSEHKSTPSLLGSPPGNRKAEDAGALEWPGLSSSLKNSSTGSGDPKSGGNQSVPPKGNPTGKRSVGNSKAFVNINGSPIRILKANGQLQKPLSNSRDFFGAKQRLVNDLFQAKGAKSLEGPGVSKGGTISSKAQSEVRGQSKLMKNERSPTDESHSKGFKASEKRGGVSATEVQKSDTSEIPGCSRDVKPSPFEPLHSKYFKSPGKSKTDVPNARKRLRDEGSSAHIFDFFQRTTTEWSKPQTLAESTVTTTPSPVVNIPPSSANCMVSCPVCHTKVPESTINEHLDTCLK